jgi:PAS domain S-box-containing protein
MSRLRFDEIAGLGFEQVVRDAPVAISVIDASGRVVFSNARALDLTDRQLGFDMPADLDGAIDIFHPDGRRYDRDEWPAVRSLTAGEEVVEEEFFYALPEGERLFIRCSSSPVRDEDDEVVAAVVTMTDVTERRRVEDERRSHASLLENIDDAVVGTDADYRVTAWNTGAERLYGFRAEEVLGRPAREVATYPGDESRTELERELSETGLSRFELTARRKDGTLVEVELIVVALFGERGEVTGYLGIHRDVSERRRAEEALRESQQRTETILQSITDEFFALDREWRYTYVNERGLAEARRIPGRDLTAADLLGVSIWERFPELLGTTFHHEAHRALREQTTVEFIEHSPVTGRWVEVRIYPSDAGLSIYLHDITQRKQAEEMLREEQEQRALADRRLDGVREAERSRIARDLHDGALQGLTHVLAVTGRHAASRDDEVRAAIYDLRLEQDGERSFADALRELIELNREMAPSSNVTLETDVDPPSASFGRRGTEVLRIIGEALTNACRHAAAERIVVRVSGGDTGLSIEVADDGRGFDVSQSPSALHGQGLRGMRERAELLGAQLHVLSDETGTTVRLDVALSPA